MSDRHDQDGSQTRYGALEADSGFPTSSSLLGPQDSKPCVRLTLH